MFERIELILTPLIALDTIVRIIFHGEAPTVARVVASLQRALQACMGRKNVEIPITCSDLYQQRLRKPWMFHFFFSHAPQLKIASTPLFFRRANVRVFQERPIVPV